MANKKLTLKKQIIRRLEKGLDAKQIVAQVGCSPAMVYTTKNGWKKEKGLTTESLKESIEQLKGFTDERASKVEESYNPIPAFLRPDMVNDPPHYKRNGVEVVDVIEAFELNYRLGNVVKYILRHVGKNGLEDLKKAQWYLNREISKHEG